MVQAQTQKAEFQDRLDRIKRGGPNTLGHVYVGPVEGRAVRAKNKRFGFVAKIWALLIGSISYLVGHLIYFKLAPMLEGAYPQIASFWMAGGALGLAVPLIAVLLYKSRLRGMAPYVASMFGAVLAVGMHQYLVVNAPELHASLYSDAYVQEILNPNSPVSDAN